MNAVLNEIREAAEPNFGTIAAEYKDNFRFEGVTFSYGKVHVLDSVDLEIPFGEITVITGPSGAGKTTIADLMLGIFRRCWIIGFRILRWRHTGFRTQSL